MPVANPVRLTLSAVSGTITLASLAGLSFTTGDGAGDTTLVFMGGVADVNAALNGLRFAPAAHFNGAAQLQVAVNDLGNTGAGGAFSDSGSIDIQLAAVNDAATSHAPAGARLRRRRSDFFGRKQQPPRGHGRRCRGEPAQGHAFGARRDDLAGRDRRTYIFSGRRRGGRAADVHRAAADINAALDGLRFDPASHSGALAITVEDQGYDGAGGNQMVSGQVALGLVAPTPENNSSGVTSLVTSVVSIGLEILTRRAVPRRHNNV